jgi:hypothetical protein
MNRIPLNVLTFAQGKTDFYEAIPDYVNHYRAEHNGAKVSYDNSLTFAEKTQKMHEALLKEIKRHANINSTEEFSLEVQATNPMFVWATFAVVDAAIDMIIPQTIIDSIGTYTDVRQGGFVDSFAFECKPRDLFAVTKATMGKRHGEIQEQYDGQVTLTPILHDVTVAVDLYRVLAGYENLAEFLMKAARSMETEMAYDAYVAMNTAATALPTTPSGGELKITGYTQTDAVRLASSVSAFNMGSQAVFAGTKSALSNILPNDANYRYELESDYVKVGYIRTAFGYDTLAFPQIADWKNPFKLLLDDTRVYVISPSSQKIIKLCLGGNTLAIDGGVYGMANLKHVTTLKKKWIAGVATASCMGLIICS